jgi:hypothetical protein
MCPVPFDDLPMTDDPAHAIMFRSTPSKLPRYWLPRHWIHMGKTSATDRLASAGTASSLDMP